MNWKNLVSREKVLACIDHAGFREVFASVVTFAQPVRYDGYRLTEFLCYPLANSDSIIPKMNEWTRAFTSTYELPENDLQRAAIYFWIWRTHGKGCHPDAGALADGCYASAYSSSEPWTWIGQWSLFLLLYLESKSWNFPRAFTCYTDKIEKMQKEPRFNYVYQEVCRLLCGVRTTSSRLFSERTGTDEQYRKLCAETKREFWDMDFAKAQKTPELVLALAFYANGFAAYMTGSTDDAKHANFIGEIVDRATHYAVNMPEDDWEARSVFLVLALWLHFGGKRQGQDTLEDRIFALLYLRFYRVGVDKYFGRKSIKLLWDAIPFADKERTAGRYRKLLAKTRSDAAKKWPTAVVTDYPEIEIDDQGVQGFEEVFSDAVKNGDRVLVDKLIGEHLPSTGKYRELLLWSALKSPKMLNCLISTIGPKVAPGKANRVTEEEVSRVSSAVWGESAEGVIALFDNLGKIYEDAALARLRKCCSTVVYDSAISHDKEDDDDDGVDVLFEAGFDPNGEHSGREYDDGCPPIDIAVQHGKLDFVQWFLCLNVNLNCGDEFDTILGHAVRNSTNLILKYLLEAGADPNLASPSGRYPLEFAVMLRNEGAMWLLLSSGADPALIAEKFADDDERWRELLAIHAQIKAGEKPPVWCVNMIPKKMIDWHYDKNGNWRFDPMEEDGFDSIADYAAQHPEYVFYSSNGVKWVGIHDESLALFLSYPVLNNMKDGGAIVRVEHEESDLPEYVDDEDTETK